jgi:phosphatidylinositol alpha-1,6-mannosyltransferase
VPVVSNEKVLLVTNDFGPRAGGIESFVIGLLERMPLNSTIVYTSQQGDTSGYDQEWRDRYGVIVVRDRAKILLPTPRTIKETKRLIKKHGISRLWFGAGAPLGLTARFLGADARSQIRKSIALTHGHEVWWAKVFPFSLAIRAIGRSLDQIGYLTQYTRREIARGLAPVDRQKLIQIAPGINVEHFSSRKGSLEVKEISQKLGLEESQVIVSVGRLVHRKGQDRLIEAMVNVVREVPSAHLLIIGEGPYRSKLLAKIEKLNLGKSVTVLGRLGYQDLPNYLSLGSVFAMPSRDRLAGLEVEGLGIVYLEASSCSLPVIVGNSGGAPDALINGVTGLLVNGRSVSEISEAILKILTSSDGGAAMGSAGRDWVAKNWGWDRWAEEFQAALLH